MVNYENNNYVDANEIDENGCGMVVVGWLSWSYCCYWWYDDDDDDYDDDDDDEKKNDGVDDDGADLQNYIILITSVVPMCRVTSPIQWYMQSQRGNWWCTG